METFDFGTVGGERVGICLDMVVEAELAGERLGGEAGEGGGEG